MAPQLDLFEQRLAGPAVQVRRSQRARRLSLRVYPHGRVEVVAPPRVAAAQVQHFVDANRGWITAALADMDRRDPASSVAMPDEIRFALTGESWRLRRGVAGNGCARLLEETPGRLLLVVPPGDDRPARELLRHWLAQRGRERLLPRLETLSCRTGLRYSGASVGRQRTRWGSCSSSRHIRLNCGLLFLPPRLVHYLLAHELCHLRHLNHSRRFWRLLETVVKDARAAERALAGAWRRVPGWVHYDD